MHLAAMTAATAVSVVLSWAATEKLRDTAPLAETIRLLGFRFGRPVAMAVTLAELLCGVALLFRPDHAATQLALVALGGAFAFAALVAMRRHEAIPCSCFGGSAALGARQIVIFVLFAAVALLLRLGIDAPPSLSTASGLFAAVALALAARGAFYARREQIAARGDRRSAEEMYVWLPSH